MTRLKARNMSRRLFPHWSRRLRARWVLARLRVDEPRVPISSACDTSPHMFRFARGMPR